MEANDEKYLTQEYAEASKQHALLKDAYKELGNARDALAEINYCEEFKMLGYIRDKILEEMSQLTNSMIIQAIKKVKEKKV